MSDYDRWLEAPATDCPEPVECPRCDGSGRVEVAGFDHGGPNTGEAECPRCEGEGHVNPEPPEPEWEPDP